MALDFKKIKDLRDIADGQVKRAENYASARKKAGAAEADLKLILASKLKDIRRDKPNVGVDMAFIMLCEEDEVAQKLFREWTEQEAVYKGLEKVLEAVGSQITFEQSLMKFVGSAERYG